MEIVVRRTEIALAHLRELQARELSPVVPPAQLSSPWSKTDFPQGLCQIKAMKNTRGVRAGHYPADLAQFRRLLENRHLNASAPHSDRCSESADPGSDYYDAHCCTHLYLPTQSV